MFVKWRKGIRCINTASIENFANCNINPVINRGSIARKVRGIDILTTCCKIIITILFSSGTA